MTLPDEVLQQSSMYVRRNTEHATVPKVAEVAELTQVKPRTIYEMVSQNRIPYRKPSGSNILRFDLDEILAWTKGLHSQRVVCCRRPWLHLGKDIDNASSQTGERWYYAFGIRGVRYRKALI